MTKFGNEIINLIISMKTWHAGRITQDRRPRNHLPVKVVMGVRGAAVRHIIVSDSAMLQTKRLIPV